MELPFKQYGNVRIFNQGIDEEELVWHRDREDRLVEAVGLTDWKIQLDNELPRRLTKLIIPKDTYHRLLKGTNDLTVRVIKL